MIFRAKRPAVVEAVRWGTARPLDPLDEHTVGNDDVARFCGPAFEQIRADSHGSFLVYVGDHGTVASARPGDWLLRDVARVWSLSHAEFLDRYVQVAVGEDDAPPTPPRPESLRDLATAAEDAFMAHPGFAEMWGQSAARDRVQTRAKLILALGETAS